MSYRGVALALVLSSAEAAEGAAHDAVLAFGSSGHIVLLVVLAIAAFFVLGSKPKPFFEQQSRDTVVKVPVVAKEMLSHDTVKLTFGLPTSSTTLGLPVGACIKFFAPNVTGTKVRTIC